MQSRKQTVQRLSHFEHSFRQSVHSSRQLEHSVRQLVHSFRQSVHSLRQVVQLLWQSVHSFRQSLHSFSHSVYSFRQSVHSFRRNFLLTLNTLVHSRHSGALSIYFLYTFRLRFYIIVIASALTLVFKRNKSEYGNYILPRSLPHIPSGLVNGKVVSS